jgi:hypothetical protein
MGDMSEEGDLNPGLFLHIYRRRNLYHYGIAPNINQDSYIVNKLGDPDCSIVNKLGDPDCSIVNKLGDPSN